MRLYVVVAVGISKTEHQNLALSQLFSARCTDDLIDTSKDTIQGTRYKPSTLLFFIVVSYRKMARES
jgi:hypothetical protein